MNKPKRNKPAVSPAIAFSSAKVLTEVEAEAAEPDNKELKKVSLHVNEFGEIVRDIKTDEINAFLDENVPDKKFTE